MSKGRGIFHVALGIMVLMVLFSILISLRPAAAADLTRPVITIFTLPATSSSLTVSGINLTASDNVGVTGYYLSTSFITPRASSSGWKTAAPTSYTFSSAGTKTLYAWAKDAAGNISLRRSAQTRIVLSDTQAPTVSITSPANNAIVSGTIIISASAADNVGVSRVEFYINGGLDYTDTAGPYSYSGDSSTIPNGTYALFARAYDAAGNMRQSSTVSFTISNSGPDTTLPVISTFTVPTTSTTLLVSGIRIVASDNIGVTGYYLSTVSTTPAAGDPGWNSVAPTSYTFTSAGTKTLYAWARDGAGNVSARRSASVTITLPDTQAPTVSITSPADNATVSGMLTISASATDNVGVTRVEFYIDGVLDHTDTTAPYSDSGDTSTVPDGSSYLLTARAYDAAGNAGLSAPVRIVVNNSVTSSIDINLAQTGTPTLNSPWDTWALWTPLPILPADAVAYPMIRYVAFFNATGGMPSLPENELYDEDGAGNPVYRFDRLTTKLDTVLAAGMKPYIVLSYTPVKLASDPAAISAEFGTNTSPPKDWNKYYNFIRAFFEELNSRYGVNEVASWRFRCGSEPDSPSWWSGTMEQWFTFYDFTVSAARAANPSVEMRISINPGNYMTTTSQFISGLAARIQAGTFSIPGESPIVPSVISFSYYIDDPVKIDTAVANIRSVLAPYPLFAGIPLSIDEGYVLDDENGKVMFSRLDGTELGGSHFALLTTTMVDQDIKWAALWNPGSAEVPPPARNVLNLFHQLLAGGAGLDGTTVRGNLAANDVIGGLAARPAGGTAGQARLMLFNYNYLRSASTSAPLLLRLRGVPAGGVRVTYYRIDRTHANYSVRWLADSAGIPRTLNPPYDQSPYDLEPRNGIVQQGLDLWDANKATYAALAQVVAEAESAPRLPAADGTLEIPLTLPPHGVLFIQLEPAGG